MCFDLSIIKFYVFFSLLQNNFLFEKPSPTSVLNISNFLITQKTEYKALLDNAPVTTCVGLSHSERWTNYSHNLFPTFRRKEAMGVRKQDSL